ncbi:MAG: hypothetical protein BWX79_02756 [Alphaproteobacteria bacterium ADurb.Bin100]|nr:MAG: hypothetical protein BWX79_02756 [Alphaproteobacteria bacterium ADurb.Bin100]
METVLLRLVAFAEADQVGRNHAVALRGKHGNHLAVQVAPGRVAMQAEPGHRGVGRAFIKVVQAQSSEAGQVVEVVRRPGVSRQTGKAVLGRAQGVVAQGMGRCHTSLLEEGGQQSAARCGQIDIRKCVHPGLVVQLRLAKQVEYRTRRAGLGIRCPKDHPLQARVQHGTAAHRTGLQSDIQRTARQPVVAQVAGCRPQCDDLGVCTGIVQTDRCIATGADHHSVLDHHGPYRHLAGRCGGERLGQRQAHPACIGARRNRQQRFSGIHLQPLRHRRHRLLPRERCAGIGGRPAPP